jgi:ferric-dicitrate binding protein FerR (iron transport regulator)
MKHDPQTALDRIVREAREDLVPDTHGRGHDWSEVDRRVFDRIARTSSRIGMVVPTGAGRPIVPVAIGLALAAAAAATLFFRPLVPVATQTVTAEIAASVGATSGLRINGAEVGRSGAPIRVGDRLETTTDVDLQSLSESGARAVAWRLEGGSSVLVNHARLPLGVALERGAVEADVERVPSGEAFAVDVGPVRVAVRGTHLRVARNGESASVDLTAGTIAIGPIPAPGAMTEGELVSAPAHVDIDLLHPAAIHVDRKEEMVRAPSPKVPTNPVAHAGDVPRVAPSLPLLPSPSPAPAKPAAGSVDTRTPNETLADAVRACVVKHLSSGTVHVTVTSTLILDLEKDGSVRLARFEPPLAPEVQTCASDAIYKTHFAPGGATERITIVAER